MPDDRRRRLTNDKRIRRSARTVFARRGYTAATMDLIAAEAGVTKPTLYAHYPSKAALFADAVSGVSDDLTDRLFAATYGPAGDDLQQSIHAAVRAYFQFFAEHPEAFDLLHGPATGTDADATPNGPEDQIRRRVASMAVGLASRHGFTLSADDAAIVAAALLGISRDTLASARHRPSEDRMARACELSEILTVGAASRLVASLGPPTAIVRS